jgi:hypothetical protein
VRHPHPQALRFQLLAIIPVLRTEPALNPIKEARKVNCDQPKIYHPVFHSPSIGILGFLRAVSVGHSNAPLRAAGTNTYMRERAGQQHHAGYNYEKRGTPLPEMPLRVLDFVW